MYCDALVATGVPVRLVSTRVAQLQLDGRGRSHSQWIRHRDLLATSMVGDYVNVVCSEVADWPRYATSGVSNALLVTEVNLEPRNNQSDLVDAVKSYDLIYAPSVELAQVLERVTGRRSIIVPLGDPQAGVAFSHLKLAI